jgi:hypothetical protein
MAGEGPTIGSAQKRMETGFTLLTAREDRSGFGLSFRKVQRAGQSHRPPRFCDGQLGSAKAYYL